MEKLLCVDLKLNRNTECSLKHPYIPELIKVHPPVSQHITDIF